MAWSLNGAEAEIVPQSALSRVGDATEETVGSGEETTTTVAEEVTTTTEPTATVASFSIEESDTM